MVAQTQAPRRRLRAALLAGLAALALALPCEARHRANAPAPAPQSVVASYQTRIHPILVTKCAACHTGTPERPLYYFIPVLNLWSQPFIEDHIRQARSEILKARMQEPFLWGGQKVAGDYDLEHSPSNRFNPLAWRKMYLSLFMFDGNNRVEKVGDQTIIHMPAQFRGQLDSGEYPYPFWHSEKKWDDYNYSTEVMLVYREGKLRGAFRSAVADKTRPKVVRTWDHKWHWFKPGATHEATQTEPRVTLYSSLFTPKNPHVKELDSAYRKLALGFNRYKCFECHTPANYAKMNMLEFFNYPNQALTGRNRIIAVLEDNAMPPIDGIGAPRDRQPLLGPG